VNDVQLSVFDDLIERVQATDAEVAELRERCLSVPDDMTVNAFFGYLIVETWQESHPQIAAFARESLERLGLSKFGEGALALAVALVSYVGTHVFPEHSLVDATNDAMETFLVSRRDSPFLQTFVRATGGSWHDFMSDFAMFNALVGTLGDIYVERTGRREVTIYEQGDHVHLYRYTTLGFFRGLLGVYEQDGEVEHFFEDDEFVSVTILRW